MSKTVGIVRNIDKLGRVVLPMETRRCLRMDVGDPLEINMQEDSIILRKYQPKKLTSAMAQRYANILEDEFGVDVVITDPDFKVVASTNSEEFPLGTEIIFEETDDVSSFVVTNSESEDNETYGYVYSIEAKLTQRDIKIVRTILNCMENELRDRG